jgi:hypothetical protein
MSMETLRLWNADEFMEYEIGRTYRQSQNAYMKLSRKSKTVLNLNSDAMPLIY